MLERFNMKNSNKRLLLINHGIKFSNKMSPKSPKEKKRTSTIPYSFAVGSIMYSMLCTRPIVTLPKES